MNAVIAQSDVVTAYGWGLDALWNGLLSGKTAVKASDRFAGRGSGAYQLASVPDLILEGGASRSMAMLNRLLAPLVGKLDRRTPLLLATTVGEIEYVEQAVFGDQPQLVAAARPDVLLNRIKRMLGLTGSAMVVSSACASSTAAVTRAAAMIRRGEAPAVLVVTCDAISEFVYSGFSTLLSLCETPARPFDATRSGLSLGESAAYALITSDVSPLASRSTAILGWGSATDAIHMTAPDRNAGGLSRAIAKACTMAGADAAEIAFIAAHGTATIYNDAMELVAFREAVSRPIPLFSIKGAVGHTLATAGLLQILVAARAMSLGVVPPTVGMTVPDPEAQGWVHDVSVILTAAKRSLSTNSGFGGVNTAILLGQLDKKTTNASVGSALADGPASIRLNRSAFANVDPTQLNRPASAKADPKQIVTPTIRSVAWLCADHCGNVVPGGESLKQPAPALSDSKEMLALIGRPVKYLSRMGPEARACLAVASMAMKAAGWHDAAPREIGILAAGYDRWLAADEAYFRDYVASGLTLGRGNLFIYTLPTSTQSEVSIALNLTGPTLHIQDDAHPVHALFYQAEQLLADGEADAILVLHGDARASVCFALAAGRGNGRVLEFPWDATPLEMATNLAARAG